MSELTEQIKEVFLSRIVAAEAVKVRKTAYMEWELGHQSLIDAVTETTQAL